MINATIRETKTHLSRLVKQVEAGETVTIPRGDVAVARLVPVRKAKKRNLAIFKNQFRVGPEFFAPLPEDELRAWHIRGK